MNVAEILSIVSTYGGITTFITIIGGWYYRKQNKRLKESEAALAEANVNKARSEVKADEWKIWKEQLEAEREHVRFKDERISELLRINAEKEDRHQQDIKDWEARFTDQTKRLREVQRNNTALHEEQTMYIKRIAKVEKERDHYKMWRCFREHTILDPVNGCGRREPQQPIPIKYVPLDDDACIGCDKECEINNDVNTIVKTDESRD